MKRLNITIHWTLDDKNLILRGQRVPEQSSLKGDSIELLANFGCVENNTKWFILVYWLSLPIGAVSSFCLPEGIPNIEYGDISGTIVTLIESACNSKLNTSIITNLIGKVFETTDKSHSVSYNHGIYLPSGLCSKLVQTIYHGRDITYTVMNNSKYGAHVN